MKNKEGQIDALLRHYEKQAGLEKTDFSIHPQNFNGPVYLEFVYFGGIRPASEIKLLINKNYINHRFIGLSLCHELGHIKKIKSGADRKFIDPKTTWEWIIAEVSADREAAKIYGKPFKRDMLLWLSEKVCLTIKNMGEKRYKHFIRKQLIVGIARLLSATVA